MIKLDSRFPLVIFTFIVLILSGCKKKDAENDAVFPVKFYADRIEPGTDVRIFNKNGEVKDPEEIAKYANSIFFKTPTVPEKQGELMFYFSNKKNATFNYDGNSVNFSVVKTNDQFLFTSTGKKPLDDGSYLDKIFKYTPIEQAMEFSSANILYNKIAYGNYQTIKFPIVISSIAQSFGNNQTYNYIGKKNNEINESQLSKLKENEFVVYKTYYVVYVAR